MSYDRSTYVPGDPWTAKDFISQAGTAPQIQLVTSTPGEATEGSYFETRFAPQGRTVTVTTTASGSFNAVLERSTDDGVTYAPVQTFTGSSSVDVPYETLAKLRLRLVSTASGPVTLRLEQQL